MPHLPVRLLPRQLRVPRSARGFTLLEVLVSILILSFGVLGAAGMQIAALQANKEARYQANAARLGAQLADLMRANVSIARSSNTANVFLLDNVSGSLPAYTDDCIGSSCTAAVQAKSAVKAWVNQLGDSSSGLPEARVVVCFDDAPFDANNKPRWACNGTSATARPFIKIGWTSTTTNSMALDSTTSSPAIPKLILDVIPG